MNLHNNKPLLKDAILATAAHLQIRDIYVEKDYWVTVALYEIFHDEIGSQAVFKGGTALSKCHKLIDRFSEDLDIVALRNRGETDSQLINKIRKISNAVERIMPEITIEGLTNKRGNIRKTVHQYDKMFESDWGQAREHVVLEATWLGNSEPFAIMPVNSYIYDMMVAKGQHELVDAHNLAPFSVQVLSTQRTFCEKIMSLVRFSRSTAPIMDLRNKIRHIYDLHQMMKDMELQQFFNSPDFYAMLINVGQDDMIGYKNNNAWIHHHPSSAMVFANPHETWDQLRTAYTGNFRDLVTGNLPDEMEILETLCKIADRLRKINWKLT